MWTTLLPFEHLLLASKQIALFGFWDSKSKPFFIMMFFSILRSKNRKCDKMVLNCAEIYAHTALPVIRRAGPLPLPTCLFGVLVFPLHPPVYVYPSDRVVDNCASIFNGTSVSLYTELTAGEYTMFYDQYITYGGYFDQGCREAWYVLRGKKTCIPRKCQKRECGLFSFFFFF
jgi:hypothetical protein